MTLISRVKCDTCGQEEEWPPARYQRSGETSWIAYLAPVYKPVQHACSSDCLIQALRSLGPAIEKPA